jgi:uncharacterized protein
LAAFVDSSAIVKLYVVEPGSEWMDQVIRPSGIAVSELTVAETGVTLSRRARDGSISEGDARDAWRLFRRELRSFLVYRTDRSALVGAANIAARSPLIIRSLDAIQLRGATEAMADARRKSLALPVFVSADERLLRAAAALGFSIDNPMLHI